jgi:hypothetical protein
VFLPDKKKAVSVILAKMKPGGGESHQEIKPEAEINDHDEILKSIAEDLMQGVKDGSAHDVMMALKAFMDQIELLEPEAE